MTASRFHLEGSHDEDLPERPVMQSLFRGVRQRCPACGEGALMKGYLGVKDECAQCGEELHHQRADDAPPYFTILIVGHIVVPLALLWEMYFHPPLWMQAAVWGCLTLGLTLFCLPRIKGALVGLQWALRMHGFGPVEEDENPQAAE